MQHQQSFSMFLRASLTNSTTKQHEESRIDEPIATLLDALDAADDQAHESIARALEAHIKTRIRNDGLTLATGLDEITSAHVTLLERAREAAAAGVSDVWEGMIKLGRLIGAINKIIAGVFLEISEKEKRAIATSERNFREFYQRTPVMMHFVDKDFRMVEMSDRWLETMEYTREEVIGRVARDFATEETRNISIAKVAPDFFRTGRTPPIHYQYVTKNGKIIDFMLEAVLRRDDQGNPLGAMSALMDVTERLRMERALRESEERYRVVVERSPLGIFVHCEHSIVFANRAAATILGATGPEELLGLPTLDRVAPEYRTSAAERLKYLYDVGDPIPLRESRFLRIDGSAVDVAILGTLTTHEGKPAVQVIFIDISERFRARELHERAALQEETIRAQEESLLALSTPLIPVSERVLVMPLIGRINEGRTQRILDVLLNGVTNQSATHVILDVTGVPEADTGMADALIRASQAVRLLGAKVILTGIQPAFARTLIELGVDLSGLVTQSTLASGIRAAMGRR